MKVHPTILLRIGILLIVLFFTGVNAFSIEPNWIAANSDLSTELNIAETTSLEDIESIDDEQIYHINEQIEFHNERIRESDHNNTFVLFNPTFYVWQPPKI